MKNIVLLILLCLSHMLLKLVLRELRLKYYRLFNKNKYFSYSLKLANKGYFKYEGLVGSKYYQRLPQGRIHYPDGVFF